MPPFDYDMAIAPTRSAIRSDTHQSEEQNERAQMEVYFRVTTIFHLTKFEGTLRGIGNFGVAVASGQLMSLFL
jgi:hypothetical protein